MNSDPPPTPLPKRDRNLPFVSPRAFNAWGLFCVHGGDIRAVGVIDILQFTSLQDLLYQLLVSKFVESVREFLDKWKRRAEAMGKLVEKGRKLLPRNEIVIIGCGGVGKTTLSRYLAGDFQSVKDVPGDYLESVGMEEVTVEGLFGVTALVPPGQFSRQENFWPQLANAIEHRKHIRGVIYVGAYGFHNPGTDSLAITKESFEKLVHEKLTLEKQTREILIEWCSKRKHPLWVLEVVAKQDLWYGQSPPSAPPYEPDLKTAILAKEGELTGEMIFHQRVDVAFKISPIRAADGSILHPSSPEYESSKQSESLQNLDKAIAAIKSWKYNKV